uniref:DUF4283 domain-containing protein n=1 Tax=Solanum tuberosum TaxID=4113 RepID=M1DLG3_SOLTU
MSYICFVNQRNQQSTRNFLNQSVFFTVVFDSKDLETFITEENLKFALIAKFSHGRPELPDLRKILPQQLGFKGECNIGLLESRHVLLQFTLKEDYIAIFSKTSRSIKFAAVGQLLNTKHDLVLQGYDYLPYYCKHREANCRTLTDGQVDATVSENHIEGEKIKKADSNRLEVGEKDDEGTVKDLQIGAEKSGVQDQNLVRQNSGQCLGKAVLDDYSSGNRMLSLIPQTDEFSRKKNTSPNQESCNSADRIEVEEQLVVDTNQSNDAQFAQKIN